MTVTNLQATLIAELKGQMKRNKVTQTELARRTGLSVKHVNGMLQGHVEGRLSTWQRLFDHAYQRPPEGDV